jgi:hypothetical protein
MLLRVGQQKGLIINISSVVSNMAGCKSNN